MPTPEDEQGSIEESPNPLSETPASAADISKPPSADADPPPIVEFIGVEKTYAAGTDKAFTAISDVNFSVPDLPNTGEFVGILGPSGCGKSTILRLIAGLAPQFPHTKGQVLVHGQPVTKPGPDRGMVFQDYTSFSNRTVLDNVAFGLECQGMSKADRYEISREWIGKVGLDPDADSDKYPHQLSGGMKQRVAIARSLILKPRIILMDEPFGALDPVTRQRMQDLLVGLWRELEATVFFVTHDVPEAVYLGDRIYMFSNSPGTILRELEVPLPDRPSRQMQRETSFQDLVYEIGGVLDELEEGRD